MMKKTVWFPLAFAAIILIVPAQQSDVIIKLTQGERPAVAVPDFRGSGEAQAQMGALNQTLFSDLETSGLFKMAPKSMYPLQTPQRPEDLRSPAPGSSAGGLALSDWSSPPVSANY